MLLQLMQPKLVLLEYLSNMMPLRSCFYWARILDDCEAHYGAYKREALNIVETVSHV